MAAGKFVKGVLFSSRLFIQVLLFTIFSLLFALPAIRTYQKREVSNTCQQKNITRNLWKDTAFPISPPLLSYDGSKSCVCFSRWWWSHLRRRQADFRRLPSLFWQRTDGSSGQRWTIFHTSYQNQNCQCHRMAVVVTRNKKWSPENTITFFLISFIFANNIETFAIYRWPLVGGETQL